MRYEDEDNAEKIARYRSKNIGPNETLRFPNIDWTSPDAEALYGKRPTARPNTSRIEMIAASEKNGGDDNTWIQRQQEAREIAELKKSRGRSK